MDRQVFADHARMYEAARRRLESWHERPLLADNLLQMVDQKIRHFRVRSEMRLHQRNRLVRSVVELLTLRYRRYSLGWKSFAQDLFL